MIATLFGKKKVDEEKAATIFVNAILRLTEQGFAIGGRRIAGITRVREEA